uniref:Uncharacterized protein n=1 Tax=Vespula pensylvanica TaxID=30213 RepID=A0A834UB91_VESPE|nr:hypothetical protein H0235_007136 [Vespula pensylvanica]
MDFRLQNVRGNPCSLNHSLFPPGTEPHPPVIARNLYGIVKQHLVVTVESHENKGSRSYEPWKRRWTLVTSSVSW